MTDQQILAQAEAWRLSASEARREQRNRDGSVTATMEIHCVTLEACASRLENLVRTFPSTTDKLAIWKEHLVNQTDFIVRAASDLGVVQGLAKQLGYRLKTTKIDDGWLLARLYA